MFQGMSVIAKEVREGNVSIDERWAGFSSEEIQALCDGMYNYESGIPSLETQQHLYRTMLSELKRRDN